MDPPQRVSLFGYTGFWPSSKSRFVARRDHWGRTRAIGNEEWLFGPIFLIELLLKLAGTLEVGWNVNDIVDEGTFGWKTWFIEFMTAIVDEQILLEILWVHQNQLDTMMYLGGENM